VIRDLAGINGSPPFAIALLKGDLWQGNAGRVGLRQCSDEFGKLWSEVLFPVAGRYAIKPRSAGEFRRVRRAWRVTILLIPPGRPVMNFSIECEEEVDGRWIAEVPQLPGVLCYGKTADDAMAKAEVLALRAMADRLEQNESRPVEINISIPLAA
jgi:predicted RNase H-like HicB family nuclease